MAEKISRDFIELLLAKIDIVDLIQTQLPLQKKSGNNYFARCPFHNEKTASFSVSHTKQFFHCFGCGVHGNAIDFLMQHDRLTFPEAVDALARQAGMVIPQDAKYQSGKQDDSLALYPYTEKISKYYYQQLSKAENAINYLKSRGIDGKIAQLFQLGYAPNGWSNILNEFGRTADDIQKLLAVGLIIQKNNREYYDRFRNRIMFPIHDRRGRIIGFGGRVLDQEEPKYLNSPETVLFRKGQELYGIYQALKFHRELSHIIVVEGYMDVIALFQQGITNAVATLGTATTANHFKMLSRYTSDIIFCFDGDSAGRTAAWRALVMILSHMADNLQVRFLFLPDGEDPDSMVRKEGKAAFLDRIKQATTLSDFFFQHLSLTVDTHTLDGRAKFAALALNHLKQIQPNLFQSMLLDELSKRTRIDITELKNQLGSNSDIQSDNLLANIPKKKVKLPVPIRLAIALLIQEPSLIKFIPESFESANLPGFAFLCELITVIRRKPSMTTAMLLENWRGSKEEESVRNLAHWQSMIPSGGVEKEFLGTIQQIDMLIIEDEINRLLDKANQAELSHEEKLALTTFISRKKKLTSELSA